MTEYERVVKVIVLGDSGVGKSAIVQRYTSNKFDDFYDTTIGIDFASRNVILDNIKAKIQIWDTAGQERFRSLTKSYMRGTRCAILIFDVCDRQTFLNIESWIGDLNEMSLNCSLATRSILRKIELYLERKQISMPKNMECFTPKHPQKQETISKQVLIQLLQMCSALLIIIPNKLNP
jgi:GTPase SAR1 family protein